MLLIDAGLKAFESVESHGFDGKQACLQQQREGGLSLLCAD